MLKVGDIAPNFSFHDTNGEERQLRDVLKEGPVVLFFYPHDDTPTCTKEACDFRDRWGEIQNKGAMVIGISADTNRSHEKFQRKYKLPFPLVSDGDKAISKAYGVYGSKKLFGISYQGIIRSTFIVGRNQKIKKAFKVTRIKNHVDSVLTSVHDAK